MFSLRECKKYFKEESGAVVIMFSVSIMVIFIVAGLAIDFSRQSKAKQVMQSSADAAILATLKHLRTHPDLSKSEMTAYARTMFDHNTSDMSGLTIDTFEVVPVNGDYELVVSGNIHSTLMKLAGFDTLNADATSMASATGGRPLEVALVLDATGSMAGSKIATLRTAANNLADVLMDDNGSEVKIAVVPFQDYVNVGMQNRNASWIDVPADNTVTTNHACYQGYPQICKSVQSTCYDDNGSYACTTQSCQDDLSQPTQQICPPPDTNTYKWKGCVGSREPNFRAVDGSFGVSKVPGILNAWCSTPITPLTNEKNKVTAAINAINTGSKTYIPSGLTWGWYVLSSKAPYDQAANGSDFASKQGVKSIVLMTDGFNTRRVRYHGSNRPYINTPGGDHWGWDPDGSVDANAKTAEICKAIDDDTDNNIVIHTIAFQVTDQATKSLLKKCAKDTGGSYFDAGSNQALTAAFSEIAGTLGSLRLVR